MKTHVLAFGVALATTCFCVPAHAQWAVVDVDAIAQLTHQVEQQAQQIQIGLNTYNQAQAMAMRMYNMRRYRGPQNIFQAIKYADQYATLADWAVCENSGCDDRDPTQAANVLSQSNDFLKSINSGLASTLGAMYSTQEVMDGHNLEAIRAVGKIRNAAAQYESALQELENDNENDDDSYQSDLAAAERTANSSVLNARMTKDLISLTAAQLDEQIGQTKMYRDQLAATGNAAAAVSTGWNQYGSVYDGAPDSWLNWSLTTSH